MVKLPIEIETVKGFLHSEEGEALYNICLEISSLGPALEVGSYCGKSSIYLGLACRERNNTLYTIDHHRGSEEHQPGESYHDEELFDLERNQMDSFSEFRKNIEMAGLSENVIPIVASSLVVSKNWVGPLGMVFIDGGHSMEAALNDYRAWSCHIRKGGFLAIHDIFLDPSEGGQAPHEVMKLALSSSLFVERDRVKTLAILERI
jgi:predicted O-methyltransferase YrrM